MASFRDMEVSPMIGKLEDFQSWISGATFAGDRSGMIWEILGVLSLQPMLTACFMISWICILIGGSIILISINHPRSEKNSKLGETTCTTFKKSRFQLQRTNLKHCRDSLAPLSRWSLDHVLPCLPLFKIQDLHTHWMCLSGASTVVNPWLVNRAIHFRRLSPK